MMILNETEVYELITTEMKSDERILAAYMNGSRCNRLVEKDCFQDFDLVFVVQNTASFYEDKNYMSRYGTIAYLQCPEAMDFELGKAVCLDENYGWLVQYQEGHRIDLHVQSLNYALNHILEDSLCVILMDKGNYLPKLPPSSEKSYYVKRPSEAEFLAGCNEFWWCLNNVAKGLARCDLVMVLEMQHNYLRKELLKMLAYEAAYPYEFKINIGKFGNRIHNYLDAKTYTRYLSTFVAANKQDLIAATQAMIALFEVTSLKVANLLDYNYNQMEADASKQHLGKTLELELNAFEDTSW